VRERMLAQAPGRGKRHGQRRQKARLAKGRPRNA
jgi:hypothetical protein